MESYYRTEESQEALLTSGLHQPLPFTHFERLPYPGKEVYIRFCYNKCEEWGNIEKEWKNVELSKVTD